MLLLSDLLRISVWMIFFILTTNLPRAVANQPCELKLAAALARLQQERLETEAEGKTQREGEEFTVIKPEEFVEPGVVVVGNAGDESADWEVLTGGEGEGGFQVLSQDQQVIPRALDSAVGSGESASAPASELSFLPVGYEENKADLEAARVRGTALTQAALGIEITMRLFDPTLSFENWLLYMAKAWDSSTDKNLRTAIMAILMQKFHVRLENMYLALIGRHSISNAFKQTLYRDLTRKFQSDPTWQGPLDNAMKQARVLY